MINILFAFWMYDSHLLRYNCSNVTLPLGGGEIAMNITITLFSTVGHHVPFQITFSALVALALENLFSVSSCVFSVTWRVVRFPNCQ